MTFGDALIWDICLAPEKSKLRPRSLRCFSVLIDNQIFILLYHGGSYRPERSELLELKLELFFSTSSNLNLELERFFSSSTGIGWNLELFFSSSSKLELTWNCFPVPVPTVFRTGTVGTVFFKLELNDLNLL